MSEAEVDARDAEEKRIAFVALNRAQRHCVVALPDDAHCRAAAVVGGLPALRPSTLSTGLKSALPISCSAGQSGF